MRWTEQPNALVSRLFDHRRSREATELGVGALAEVADSHTVVLSRSIRMNAMGRVPVDATR